MGREGTDATCNEWHHGRATPARLTRLILRPGAFKVDRSIDASKGEATQSVMSGLPLAVHSYNLAKLSAAVLRYCVFARRQKRERIEVSIIRKNAIIWELAS
jgi:hypothetical protein